MPHYNVKDLLGGAVLLAFGGFVAIYALLNYPVGTPSKMGPGMFPVAVGILTGLLGLVLLFQARSKAEPMPKFRVLVPLLISLGIVAFALLIRPFGLVPAVIALTVISSFAELEFRPVTLVALCVSLGLMAWLIFNVALSLPIPAFRWPF